MREDKFFILVLREFLQNCFSNNYLSRTKKFFWHDKPSIHRKFTMVYYATYWATQINHKQNFGRANCSTLLYGQDTLVLPIKSHTYVKKGGKSYCQGQFMLTAAAVLVLTAPTRSWRPLWKIWLQNRPLGAGSHFAFEIINNTHFHQKQT